MMKPTPEDLLISRVIDRIDAPSDWRELHALADSSPAIWDELLTAMRQDAAVRSSLASTLSVADRVAVPAAPMVAKPHRWSWGWVAAAVLAAAWSLTALAPTSQPARATDAMQALSPAGVDPTDVIGELSRVVVEARPTADNSAFEVIYMRRLLERAVVPELYELAHDEHGAPMRAGIDPVQLAVPTRY